MKYCSLKAIYLLVYHVNTLQIIRWYQTTKNIDGRFFLPKPSLGTHTIRDLSFRLKYQLIKTLILFSEHAIWFIKCIFHKIWLVETSTIVMKYKSREVKSNPALFLTLQRICNKIKMPIILVYPEPLEVNYK